MRTSHFGRVHVVPLMLSMAVIVGANATFAQSTGGDIKFVANEQAGEMSHSSLIGLNIKNPSGQVVGDVNYLVIDPMGQVTTVVVGVGGVLGLAEKNVGVPFAKLKITKDANRNLQATLDTTVDALRSAPAYTWTEKSTLETMKEKAKDLSERAQEKAKDWSEKAQEKAKELSDKTKEKASEMREKMATDKPTDTK